MPHRGRAVSEEQQHLNRVPFNSNIFLFVNLYKWAELRLADWGCATLLWTAARPWRLPKDSKRDLRKKKKNQGTFFVCAEDLQTLWSGILMDCMDLVPMYSELLILLKKKNYDNSGLFQLLSGDFVLYIKHTVVFRLSYDCDKGHHQTTGTPKLKRDCPCLSPSQWLQLHDVGLAALSSLRLFFDTWTFQLPLGQPRAIPWFNVYLLGFSLYSIKYLSVFLHS